MTAVIGSLETLPPIPDYAYPTGSRDVVAQIATSPDGRRDYPLLTIQYHSEASPGPLDNMYLFERFVGMMGVER